MKRRSLDIANYSKNAAKNFSYTKLIIYTIISLLLTVALIATMIEYDYEGKAFLFNAVALVMIAGYLFLNIKAIYLKYKKY